MKKTSIVLLLCIVAINFSFNLQDPPTQAKASLPILAQLDPYQLFLPFVSKGGRIYYVAPNGSDSNPGTFSRPLKTIDRAAHIVKSGDVVYIRTGVYYESVELQTSGTAASPIIFKPYPGESPVMDGDFSGYTGFLLHIQGDYVHVSGIEIRNSVARGIEVFGDYDLVDGVYVHHSQASGIMISYGHHSTVQNSRVWRNTLQNENEQASGWASGLSVSRHGVTYATIRNNTVWENWGEGISSFETDHVVIEGNISHDNYSTNIYISDSTNVLCQRNFVYMNPDSYVYGHGANGGIMMGDEVYTPASANITVINNIAYGNQGNFWWWQGNQGGGMKNVLIANNTFVNGKGDLNRGRGGVIISSGDHQNVRFENNIIRQDGELPVIATTDQAGITYSHNLWSKKPNSAASGSGDVIGDPGFQAGGLPFSVQWFRLTNSSIAIGKALSLPEVIVDFFGSQRDSAPDMGAIEYIP